MATQMIIRIDPEVKNRLDELARAEGKTTAQMVRELIVDYLRERDLSSYIDDLWNRISGKLRSRGVKPKDVGKTIREVRKRRDERCR